MINGIRDKRIEYPDATELKGRFLTLDEYHEIARKQIARFCSRPHAARMLRDDDAISFIAEHVMAADWRWDASKGRTLRSYRNQCAIWAIKDYISSYRTQNNKRHRSLNQTMGHDDGRELQLYTKLEDTRFPSPEAQMHTEDLRKKVSSLIRLTYLTDVQRECIEDRYFQGLEVSEIATKRGISRQAVAQNLDIALFNLRQTAGVS